MRRNPLRLVSAALAVASALCGSAQKHSPADPIALAQEQIVHYLARLADLHCNEIVTQQKLARNGHVDASESAQFDYLIMMAGNNEEFQLNESRIESPGARHKQISLPMLTTNGITTVLLVFHPYYSGGFDFQIRPEEVIDGRPATPIHFAHIQGRRTPAALALRGREFPLELEGTAWLDQESGEVVRVDATLLRDMSDVGLSSMDIHVEYKPVKIGKETLTLPARAVVDVVTPRQHWRNTHVFENYKSFSTDAEQDPSYKLHPDPPENPAPKAAPQEPQEQP